MNPFASSLEAVIAIVILSKMGPRLRLTKAIHIFSAFEGSIS
jgi:hypothetical protein